jgi:hypothetical protein
VLYLVNSLLKQCNKAYTTTLANIMKKKILIILFTVLINNINAQSEFDKVSECYFSKSAKGEKLKFEINKFEKFLISKKILKDNTGISYYDLFKRVSYSEEKTKYNYTFRDSIKKYQLENIEDCLSINSKLLSDKTSKTYLLKTAISTLQYESNISPEKVGKKILKIIEPKDFNNYLQKLKTLLLLDNFNNTSSGIFNSLEFESNKEKIDLDYLEIEINDENKIIIENIEYRLNNSFEKKIRNHNNIKLKTSRKALYSVYMKVIEELNSINKKVKNEISLKKFNKKYDLLYLKDKKEIDNEFDITITPSI